jgi:hypothetical protein
MLLERVAGVGVVDSDEKVLVVDLAPLNRSDKRFTKRPDAWGLESVSGTVLMGAEVVLGAGARTPIPDKISSIRSG